MIKNQIKATLWLLLIGCFFNCSTGLTRYECLEANWHEIGFVDGSEGEPRSKFQEHAENCLRYDVHVGREAYYRGRDQGLKAYCTQDKGFDLGILGQKYNRCDRLGANIVGLFQSRFNMIDTFEFHR